MNATQVKHARSRADAIYNKRNGAIHDEFAKRKVELSLDEKLKALKAGRFKVAKRDRSWSIDDHLVFTDEVPFPQEECKAAQAVLRAEYDALIDELVMGDQTQALELLRAFEAGR